MPLLQGSAVTRPIICHEAHHTIQGLRSGICDPAEQQGGDVRQAFLQGALDESGVRHVTAAFTPLEHKPGKFLADIYALARHRMLRAGVAQVHGGEYCTVANSGRFYSFRRDGVTGRQASLIWLK